MILKLVVKLWVSLFLNLLIVTNLKTFRSASRIFINFYAFGHSILDTCNFFSAYGSDSVCISVGNYYERNWQFKKLLSSNKLIHFPLPRYNFNNKIILRKIIGPEIIKQINKNFLLKKINSEITEILNFEETIRDATVINLSTDFSLKVGQVKKLIIQSEVLYSNNGNGNGAATQLFMQTKNKLDYEISGQLMKFEKCYHQRIREIEKLDGIDDSKICTLILRNQNQHKAHAGLDFSDYAPIVELLIQNNFIINIVGDVDIQYNEINFQSDSGRIVTHDDFGVSEKVFQIIVIKNSHLCLGDPSGLQPLVRFFDKPNLIFNNIPIGQFHFNTLMLPRLWLDRNGKPASIKKHFGELLYRLDPWVDSKGNEYRPVMNSRKTMLDVTREFLNLYQSGAIIQCNSKIEILLKDSPYSRFNQNSSISSIFIDLIT